MSRKRKQRKPKLTPVEQFEKDFGAEQLFKGILSVYARVLVKKGIISKKKLKARLEKELNFRKAEILDDRRLK